MGSLVLHPSLFAAPLNQIGLQLYTLREAIEKDLKGTLEKVAKIGYKELEAASGSKGHYYGMMPKDFASMVKDMGMNLRSTHVLLSNPYVSVSHTLTNSLQKLVDDAAEAGQQYLVCAFLFPEERESLDQYKKHAELFNEAGEACKKAGLQFAYHNHDFEFVKLDGEIPYELLLAQTDSELVKMELDLYWVTKIGLDPVQWFEKEPGRFPLWHIKDMAKTQEKEFTEVGNGSIDFQRIFKSSQKAGLEYYFVEQDETPGDPFNSIQTSYDNLQSLLK